MNERQSPANGDSAVILFSPGDYCALTNVIVVGSFTTPHHYCPMCVQPSSVLTVTIILMRLGLAGGFDWRYQDDKRRVETPCKAAGVGGTNTGLPQQRPVSAVWCRQEEINATTYYRWERELLASAETEPSSSVPTARFAELPVPV